jgi:hypothetical protein
VLAIFYQIANAKAESATLRANMSGVTTQRRLRAHEGRSRRERPSSFSFAISLWNDKEMASSPHSARAELCARPVSQTAKNLAYPLHFPFTSGMIFLYLYLFRGKELL